MKRNNMMSGWGRNKCQVLLTLQLLELELELELVLLPDFELLSLLPEPLPEPLPELLPGPLPEAALLFALGFGALVLAAAFRFALGFGAAALTRLASNSMSFKSGSGGAGNARARSSSIWCGNASQTPKG